VIQIRWHGRGGQGCFTIARLLGSAAAIVEGKQAMAFPSFGPERRGAPVLGFTKIDTQKIRDRSAVKTCDYIVILDETLIDSHIADDLAANGKIILNSSAPEKYPMLTPYDVVSVDATTYALDILGKPITNTAMLAALVAATDDVVSFDSICQTVRTALPPKIADKNIAIMHAVYDHLKGGQ
jgi:pyruvate ferredoxin oxidoreductase gamma subunit